MVVAWGWLTGSDASRSQADQEFSRNAFHLSIVYLSMSCVWCAGGVQGGAQGGSGGVRHVGTATPEEDFAAMVTQGHVKVR